MLWSLSVEKVPYLFLSGAPWGQAENLCCKQPEWWPEVQVQIFKPPVLHFVLLERSRAESGIQDALDCYDQGNLVGTWGNHVRVGFSKPTWLVTARILHSRDVGEYSILRGHRANPRGCSFLVNIWLTGAVFLCPQKADNMTGFPPPTSSTICQVAMGWPWKFLPGERGPIWNE